jgi:hypothetical protein
VGVGVLVGVGVFVGVELLVGEGVSVGVRVAEAVRLGMGDSVCNGVRDDVLEGLDTEATWNVASDSAC